MQEFGTSAFIGERLGFYCKTGRLKLVFQPPCYFYLRLSIYSLSSITEARVNLQLVKYFRD